MALPPVFAIRATRVFDGSTTLPDEKDVLIENGLIEAVVPAGSIDARIDGIDAAFVMPGAVDAHVHLSFSNAGDVLRGGVTGVLDLGAPRAVAFADYSPLAYRAAGPIVTAPGGYPTRSWGAAGYGVEVASPAEAHAAVAGLASHGAAVIKVALQGEPSLDDATLAAIVAAASGRRLATVAHALTVASVERALAAGITALAHTPVEMLPPALIDACGRRSLIVISTVRAFGDAAATRDNCSALAAAGCRIVYGTDLGNDGILPGIDAGELAILADALGSRDAALVAATAAAAAFAGLPPPVIKPGAPATLLACRDATFDSIARPMHVVVNGRAL